ncbi:hypothetical protein [Lysobacter silvisoli]|uniref:hypothetical protein n=1 Tax=Lysobacter silvisoli TaxID=2293254 RepID=UPI0011C07EEB|nr:hypothetical protein [Lysobacter silvisoli]
MIKILVVSTTVVLLGGCASGRGMSDFPLQYASSSSTLVLADDLPQLPGNGSYLAISGYVFVAGMMSFHPGKQRISYSCPGDWGWRQVIHYVPSVEYEFQKGKLYELYCENGYPKIRLRDGD